MQRIAGKLSFITVAFALLTPSVAGAITIVRPANNSIHCFDEQPIEFEATNLCPGEDVKWDWGDKKSDTGNPISHTYEEPGEYTVYATDKYGRKTSIDIMVCELKVKDPDEDDVAFLHADRVTFEAEMKPDSLTVTKWDWEITEGVGTPTTSDTETFEPIVRHPQRDYANTDTFAVKVTATIEHRGKEKECEAERQIHVVYPRIKDITFDNWHKGAEKRIIHEKDWKQHRPEWKADKEPEEYEKSVSGFVKGSNIKLTATLQTVEKLDKETVITRLYADAASWVRGAPDCESEDSIMIEGGKTETKVPMEGIAALLNDIYAYDSSNYRRRIGFKWTYRMPETGNADYVIDPEPSKNIHHVYVTLGGPKDPTVYETCLHISCRAANGVTQENVAVTRI